MKEVAEAELTLLDSSDSIYELYAVQNSVNKKGADTTIWNLKIKTTGEEQLYVLRSARRGKRQWSSAETLVEFLKTATPKYVEKRRAECKPIVGLIFGDSGAPP